MARACTREKALVERQRKIVADNEFHLQKALEAWNISSDIYSRCMSGALLPSYSPPCAAQAAQVAIDLRNLNYRKKQLRKAKIKLDDLMDALSRCMAAGTRLTSSKSKPKKNSLSPPGPFGPGAVYGDLASYG